MAEKREFKVRQFIDNVGLIRVRQADGRLRYEGQYEPASFSKHPVWTDEDLKRFEGRKDVKELDP